MRQVIRRGLKEMIVDDVPDPVVAPQHVLVRPAYSLISSGTETAGIHRDGMLKEIVENPSHLRKIYDVMKVQGPVRTVAEVLARLHDYSVLGYSGAGYVVDKDSSILDVEIGSRVAYGGEGTGHGGIIQTGRHLVARVPAGARLDQASFATLGSIALNAVRIAAVEIGEVVAVIGLGVVGQLIAQLVRLQGGRVAAVDLRPDRVDLSVRLGADRGLTSTVVEGVGELTDGHGVDCAIVAAAAKSAAPCCQALEICRDRGRIVVVGSVDMTFPWNEMYAKEVRLFMSRAYGPGSYDPQYEQQGRDYPLPYVRWTENRNMEEVLRLISAGRLQVDPLITHRFSLEDAAAAYDAIMASGSTSMAVLLQYPAAAAGDPVADYRPVRKIDVATRPKRTGQVGVALIGAGNLARWAHLPVLASHPRVSLRAIHSSSGARGKSYARRFGAGYCTTEYGDILGDQDIDVVVIASRNQHHARQAEEALRAGKHVFVEKPMALTAEECVRLWTAARDTGSQLAVGFNRRFAPFYRDLKAMLAQRGGPAVINCRVNSPAISGSFWMSDPAIGGAILGEACHFVDLLYWLLESEPVRVSAYSLPAAAKDPIGQNNLVASYHFADGSIANLTYCTIGSRTSAGERVEIFTHGLGAVTEDFKRFSYRGALRRNRARWWAEKGYRDHMHAFLDAVRQGRPPEPGVLDGVRATLGCLAMLESARALRSCTIDLAAVVS